MHVLVHITHTLSLSAKMAAMEKELSKLRQQVAATSSSSESHTHQNKPHPQTQAKSTPPNLKNNTSVSKATKPANTTTKKVGEGVSEREAAVRDRCVAGKMVAQRKTDKEQNIVTDAFSGLRIK